MPLANNESLVKDGCFSLSSSDTELQIVEKLHRLCKEKYPTEINFRLNKIQWTKHIASEMIQMFEHSADSSLQWNNGFFRDAAQSEPFFRVMEAVAKLNLFHGLTFRNLGRLEGSMDLELNPRLAAALASAIQEGGNLKSVTFKNFHISANAMAVFARGLYTATTQVVGLRELHFSYSQLAGRDESGGLMGAPEYLAAGLASNTTLRKFCLEDAKNLDDASSAIIVQALSSHPAVEVLELGSFEYGRNTIQAIHQWLRWDGCRLRDLKLHHAYTTDDDIPNPNFVQLFVQDLPQSASLESLTISRHRGVGANGINMLLGSLWKLPNLRSLDVSENGIDDFVVLATNLTDTMPAHGLRSLNLSGNTCMMLIPHGLMMALMMDRPFVQLQHDNYGAIEKSTLKVLEDVFPELGYLGPDFEREVNEGRVPSSVVLQVDRNRCLGLLQRSGATIPLSVWPLVLAKANKNPDLWATMDTSRKATILYEMLQGPVFMGRGSL